jgi:hypothetical protein
MDLLIKSIGIAGFALALTGCGTTRSVQLPPANEFLIPQISADGSKFFEFQRQYVYPDQDPTDRLLGREMRSASRQAQGDPRQIDEEIQRRVNRAFEITAYCRNGYFELYRDQTREGFFLRGECRDDANDEDRRRFDSTPIPIIAEQPRL